MELIYRDEAIKRLGDAHFKNYGNAIMVIRETPTVDAEPVRHGKWIDETFEPWGLVYHPFKCNLCGEHAEFASPYCPNCGAKMGGEEDGTDK